MSAIKKFIEKVSFLEGRGGSVDYHMPLKEANILRDELAKLLHDYYVLANKNPIVDEVIKVDIQGGKF